MPRFDGTGPSGSGPMTGRRRGVCGTLTRTGWVTGGLRTVAEMLTVVVSGVVIRDLADPHGIVRTLTGRISRRITGGPIKLKFGGMRTPVKIGMKRIPERKQHE